uniref:Choline transporter-like protein n=1 Tax=Eptatretus burgeri TaxID=7764 RepID=A0A8C4WTU6_EPTBU
MIHYQVYFRVTNIIDGYIFPLTKLGLTRSLTKPRCTWASIWHCYSEYAKLSGVSGANVTIRELGVQTNIHAYLQLRETWLIFIIILSVIEVIILVVLLFLRKRLLIAIALMKEASRVIGYTLSALFYPIITFVLIFTCIVYSGVTALYPLLKMKTHMLHFASDCPDARCIFVAYGGNTFYEQNLMAFQVFNIVAFLWAVNFVIALGQCTLAGAFASYYWTFNKPRNLPSLPMVYSFGRALRYHMGSLALGSFIITFIQVIRLVLEYLDNRLKDSQNGVARFFMRCLKCCFWCLEKFMKFVNRNAYIMNILMVGCVFGNGPYLETNVSSHSFDSLIPQKIFDFKHLLGILAFFLFSNKIPLPNFMLPAFNYYWMPILVIVGTYVIAHGFFSVYNMCVDTLFLCFLEDLERNDGSTEKPYYMPPSLMKILQKKNQA